MMNSTQQNGANGGTPLAEPTGSVKRKSCANCGGRVARYQCQTPHREFCSSLNRSTKGIDRAWKECRGRFWFKPNTRIEAR